MNCPICTESNPDGNQYCGHCGSALDPAARRLRDQVLGIIDREFKDQELVAVTVADKAEERLWRWGKVLGLALAIFIAGLGFFGFSTYREAKTEIADASRLAIQSLNKVSDQSKQTIVQKGTETIAQMQQTGATAISNMQRQAALANTQSASVVLRARASNSALETAEQSVRALQASIAPMQQQIATLNVIRDASPNTPIGNIQQELFVPIGLAGTPGPNGIPYGPNGMIETPSLGTLAGSGTSPVQLTVAPYKEGSSGSGVTAIQIRLLALGCYAFVGSGTFDAATSEAVKAFMVANANSNVSVTEFSLLSFSADAPSSWINDTTPGTVDHNVWQLLFSPSAKSCK